MKAAALVAAVFLAAPLGAETQAIRLAPRQEAVLETADGTVAWAVDPEVAEASIRYGRVAVIGRSPGATVISVASATGVRTYQVVVVSPVSASAAAGSEAGRGQSWTALQATHDSAIGRSTGSVEVVDQSRGRTRRAHVTVAHTAGAGTSSDAVVSVPSATVELSSKDGSLVFLDGFVAHSALTLNGIMVRGVHVRQGPLRLHAGYASSLLYDDLILPADAEGVAGLGYAFSRGRFSVTPAAFWYRPRKGEGAGDVVGSLIFDLGDDADPFRLRTELGYGGRWGGAAELAWDAGNSHLRLRGRYQPRGFASLALGQPQGSFAEGAWTAATGPFSWSATGSFSRYALPEGVQRSDAAGGAARLALGKGFFLSGGASVGWFDAAGGRVRTLSVPAGLGYEGGRAGVSVLYRYQQNTATNLGGSGGRVSLRASGGRLRVNAFVDAQRDVPTVDFVFSQEPRLARLLAEQGLTAQTPEDIARILSASAPLLGQGYLEGLSVNLHPWRIQGGADLTWSVLKDGRSRLRLNVLFDRTRTVAGERETTLANVSYSHRIGGAELVAGYTWSASDLDGLVDQGSSFQVGLTTRFQGAPRLPWSGSASIGGMVFGDEQATGSYARGMPPVAGARVRLDGSRVATTDGRGRFRFDGVGPGGHTVEAELPAGEGAFFTTPSLVVVASGASVGFGLSRTPARLIGFVKDDTGLGVAGVTLRLQKEGRSVTASTDSEGRFVFATAEGDYVVEIDPDSLSVGYDMTNVQPASVGLRRAEPARTSLVLPAQRALSGRVTSVSGQYRAIVRLVELGRTSQAADDGSFVFRNLKPGTYTLVALAGGREVCRRVEVPEGPALINGIELDFGVHAARGSR